MPPLRLAFQRPVYLQQRLLSPLNRRCLSQNPVLRALPSAPQIPQPSGPAERSRRLVSKELQQMPSDVGILESTFITPTGKNLPSLFRSPSALLKLQYRRLFFRLRDQFSLLILKFSSPKEKGSKFRWSLKLSRSEIAPTATALHRQMYSSFAEGDATSLRKICTDGLYVSFRARIGGRPPGESVQWELVKYNKRAKVVSNRGARIAIEGGAIRQAVVRICSRQKLTRWTRVKGGDEQIVPGSGKEKDVVEYIVLQKKYEAWRSGPWQVWGTTRETTMKDVEEWKENALK